MDEQNVETAVPSPDGQAVEVNVEVITPVVVDMGKINKKHIKRLKRGKGRLMEEVVDVMDEVVDVMGEEVDGKILVPVVIVYEKKKGKRRSQITLPF